MRARGLELNIVAMEAISAADIAARNTELRQEGLLPTGGRGPHAPEINPLHAAWMLLGFAHPVASGAGATAKRYGAFVQDTSDAGKLIDRMAALIANPDRANEIEEIRLCRSRPWVMIVTTAGDREVYRPKRSAAWGRKDHMTSGREEYVIGGGMLHQIAIDLKFDQGWAGRDWSE